MAPRTVNSFLSSYAKQLHEMDSGFPENLHCHVFRHSIGMAMYKAGIPISYIKDFLGHFILDLGNDVLDAKGLTVHDSQYTGL